MAETRVTITHPAGLHARPAALFVRTSAGFQSAITVRNLARAAARAADAKSILSLMTLGVEHGDEIAITAEGPDEAEAIAALRELVESDFGE
ncbi:MAG TPA: HPr family phosphocarrier protein [Thermomicrobiaceae bacterium]|nr:HPr family phosphocarrier protein [Thermomicrobiaceae bacterium]